MPKPTTRDRSFVTAWERERFDSSLARFPDKDLGNGALRIIQEAAAEARQEQDDLVARFILDRADGALGALGSIFA